MGWLLGLFLLVTGNVAAAVPLVDDASTRVFPHIKIFARAIGLTSEQKDWYKTHVDIVMGDSKVPGTSIKYVSWSDLAQSRPQYFALYKVLDAAGSDFNQAFLHYSQDVLLPANNSDPFKQGSTAISLREDKFFRVGIVSGSIWMGSNDAKFGNALDFDGNNPGFQISSKLGDQVLSGYTLDLWMKPAQQVSTTIATWNAGINGLWIDADGHLVMECNVDHQRKGAARYAFPVFNQWYHVVGVCSAAQGIVRLYVNGQEVGSGVTFTPGVMTIDKRMFSVAGTSSKYRGGLDDLRIYNRALTAAEVRDRYVSNTMVSNGLIGYWKFDEGEGTVVADAIGSENSFLFPIDMSSQAYGDPATNKTLPVTYDIVFGLKKNDSLYMGNPWKFGEVNFNLAQGAGAGWRGVWEYYNGSSWTSLFA
ncbi:MAG: LamG domain-containing protein [Candidatus Omnitrophota bacterium]